MTQVADGYVVVDAVAAKNASTLRADLVALGAVDVSMHKTIVSARIPIAALDQMGNLGSLQFAHPSYFTTHTGATTSQGDVAQRSNVARNTFGVDGTGVIVGVLSNSYDCVAAAAGDVASGDLPPGVNLLQDRCPNPDEGRAMMQIIHDVAPGAAQAFHTAIGGRAAFASGIGDLVTAGADVIVDDVFYFSEPMFQDGVIAQAVDAAVASGVAYFSAAGNSAAASYEGTFIDSGVTGPNSGTLHDFDPGAGTVTAQQLTVPVGTTFTLVLQWNQPFFAVSGPPGAATDVDIFLTAADGLTILARSERSNIGNDAVEAFEFTNDGSLPQGTDTTFFLKIENFRGPDPDLIKYALTDSGGGVTIDQFDTRSGTSYGHSAAAGAMSTGAAAYSETPAFGTNPPLLEPFSSRGNVPIYFQTDGTVINPPELRLKPAVVAPDRVNNTFFGNDTDGDGFPNFGGTSAAAPHAAGVAALLLDFNSTLTPAQIYSALADSTINMLSSGFDFDSGFGLIQADAALNGLSNSPPVLDAIGGRIVASGDTVNISLSANDLDGPNPSLAAPVIPVFCSLTDNGNGNGNINCSPTASHVGRHAILVTAMDSGSSARSDSKGFYVVVTGTATNNAPILSGIGNQSVDEDASLVVPLSASDPNGDSMTLSQSGLPVFCSLTDNGNGNGNISCNPLTGDAGTYTTTVTVTDDGSPNLADSETFDVVVTAPPVNQAPVLAAIGNQSVDEDASLVVPISASDPDADGMTLTQSGLPTFCSLTDSGNGSGNISCSPLTGDAGAYTTTVTVTDDGLPNLGDSETFDIVVTAPPVNQEPVLASIGDQSVDEAETLNTALSATDPDGDALTFSATGLPTFCNLTDNLNGTGDISCDPGLSDAGSYPITVTVTDDGTPASSDNESFNVVVANVNQTPVLAAIGNQSVDEGTTLTVPLSADDPDGDDMTFNATGLPTFCSLTDNLNGTGDISCDPLTGDAGTYTTTITVTDNGSPNLSDSEAFDIVVNAVATNQAPVLAAIGNQSVDEAQTLNVPLSATDPDGNALMFSATGLPTFCSLTDNLNSTGNISCNPGLSDAGSYPVTVTVTDDGTPGASDNESFNIVVADVNQPPVLAAIGDQNVDEAEILNIPLSATDPDGNALTFSATGLPTFCGLTDNLNGTGNISCNPGLSDAGSYPVTVTVTDDGTPASSDNESFNIVVADVNQPPVLAAIGDQNIDEAEVLNVPLSATDPDGNALIFSATGLPTFCSLTDNLNGTGNINCNPGFTDAGSYSVTVTVTDDGTPGSSDSESFNIVVANVNQAPVLAAIGNQNVDEAEILSIPLSATDPDGNALTFSTTGLPSFCSLTDNLNGTSNISCNPGLSDAGSYPIMVTVTDNGVPALNDDETLTIKVNGVNQAPVLALIGDQSGDEGVMLIVSLSASDFDDDGITFSQTGLPGFCSLTDNLNGSGDITCDPLTGDAGTYPTTVTVTDNGFPNLSDNETFNIVVTAVAVNRAPVLDVIGNQSGVEAATLVVLLSASDPDGDSMTFSQIGLPAFCSLTDNLNGSGNISCDPLSGDAGSYPTTVTVVDDGSPNLSDSETFDIVIAAVEINQAPLLDVIGNQTVEEGGTLIVSLSATDPDGDGMTFSQSGLPAFCGLTDNSNGSGNITCDPLTGNAGSYPVTVAVIDNGSPNLSDAEAFNIVVNAVATNQPPILDPIGNKAVAEGATLVVSVSASDPDGDAMTISQTGLPVFCGLTDNMDGTGTISCNPILLDAGTYRVTVTVTDNGTPVLSDSESINIVIREETMTLNASGGGAGGWWTIIALLLMVLRSLFRARPGESSKLLG